jgi:excisionase family DNA binding protein
MSRCVSVSEAARIKKVTRQAIYLAIRVKRLRAYRHGDTWKIFLVDLDEYDKQRYSRATSTVNGELIFDESKGYISMEKASEMVGVQKQKLYYAARTGKLKAIRKRNSWVIKVEDLLLYQDEYLTKNFTQIGAR